MRWCRKYFGEDSIVKVEVNTYDTTQWRITYRYNPAVMKVDVADSWTDDLAD